MDETKNKFKGEFRKVDINKVKPNDWNPKEKIGDNEENKEEYEKIKNNVKEKGLYEPILVRKIDDSWEIIDGYHRWLACKELGYTEIIVWDFGILTKEQAQSITLDKIYLKISASEPMTAQIIKEIKLTQPEALKLLPFNDLQVQEYLQLAEFNWDNYKGDVPTKEENTKEITCPKCGEVFKI